MKETIQHGRFAGQGFDAGRHPDADQMTAFVEQALPAHEREEMLAHLAVCPECRATVAMAAAPEELAPVESRRRPWFGGWGLAWPAGAALAALAVFAVYLQHEAVLRNGKTEQVAVTHAPELAEQAGRSVAATSSKAEEAERKIPVEEEKQVREGRKGEELARDKEQAKGGAEEPAKDRNVPLPAPTLMSNQAVVPEGKAGEEVAQPASPVAVAPALPTEAGAMRENFAGATGGPVRRMQARAAAGNNALKKAEAVEAELALPSGLPVLSMASRGQQVLAIDARNAVFLSVDAGQHWRAVPAHWAGRAVNAELVSYGSGGGFGVGGGRIATFASESGALQRQQAGVAAHQNAAGAEADRKMDTLQASNVGSAAAKAPGSASPSQSGNGRLTGTVTDRSGAAVAGATVTVSDAEGKTAGTVVTDRDGGYLVEGLATGAYDVKTEAQGFERQVAKDVSVKGAEPAVENVTLNVGASTETVQVSASSPTLETDSVMLVTPAAQKAKTKAAAAAPVFAITTDSGEQWTSFDGLQWKRK
ncbi:MAG: carboxypeptidase regulatory-like domain-containing protein [Terracidiphilus sp.]